MVRYGRSIELISLESFAFFFPNLRIEFNLCLVVNMEGQFNVVLISE
jgi:hypothetical protein